MLRHHHHKDAGAVGPPHRAPTETRENQEVRPDMSPAACSHFDTIEFTAIPDWSSAAKVCLKIGSRWVHLRM